MMTSHTRGAGFHEGELAVQQRAGVTAAAARLSGMLAPADLRGGLTRFLAGRTFAALSASDASGRLWVSPLAGPPGFLAAAGPVTLDVYAVPLPGDPLHQLAPGQPVGLLVIEFAARRRVRINGTLAGADAGRLRIAVEQAYGNCPQYIKQRHLEPDATVVPASDVRRADRLQPADMDQIGSADTFVIGTRHPRRGSDSSHRGGAAGFVRVEDDTHLWWPDYPGNNMFNTLGNLAADPAAALLFPDFATGRAVQLHGTAALEWTSPGSPGDDGLTGRRVHFTIRQAVSSHLLPVQAGPAAAYPLNPPLTGGT
jgi:predicted pyridoxine 5'-phosphate oxidase superfamily flavin-nucleotide-binding protein